MSRRNELRLDAEVNFWAFRSQPFASRKVRCSIIGTSNSTIPTLWAIFMTMDVMLSLKPTQTAHNLSKPGALTSQMWFCAAFGVALCVQVAGGDGDLMIPRRFRDMRK